MANTVFAQTVSDLLDLRNGQVFQVFTINHTTGTETQMAVDQSAVNACELAASGTGLIKEATASSGVSVGSASSGVKNIVIASGVASGTYTVVVRFAGSGAGIGSSKP